MLLNSITIKVFFIKSRQGVLGPSLCVKEDISAISTEGSGVIIFQMFHKCGYYNSANLYVWVGCSNSWNPFVYRIVSPALKRHGTIFCRSVTYLKSCKTANCHYLCTVKSASRKYLYHNWCVSCFVFQNYFHYLILFFPKQKEKKTCIYRHGSNSLVSSVSKINNFVTRSKINPTVICTVPLVRHVQNKLAVLCKSKCI